MNCIKINSGSGNAPLVFFTHYNVEITPVAVWFMDINGIKHVQDTMFGVSVFEVIEIDNRYFNKWLMNNYHLSDFNHVKTKGLRSWYTANIKDVYDVEHKINKLIHHVNGREELSID